MKMAGAGAQQMLAELATLILYGPLSNGATTVMFEGVPSYPDYDFGKSA